MNDLIDKKEEIAGKADSLKGQADISSVLPERKDVMGAKKTPDQDLGPVGPGNAPVAFNSSTVTSGNSTVILGNTTVISGNPNVIVVNPDITSGNQDVISSKIDVVPVNPEVICANTDVIHGNTDVIYGNTDVILDNTDVIPDNTDVGSGNTDVIPGNTDVTSESPEVIQDRADAGNDEKFADFKQISSNSKQISSDSTRALASSAKTPAPSVMTSSVPERPEGSGRKSYTVREKIGLGAIHTKRIRPKAPSDEPESKSSSQTSGGGQVNETEIQRRLEFLEKYEKIRRTIPKDKRNNLSSLMKFKELLLEYPEFTFPGAWRLRLRKDPEGIYHDKLLISLKEELKNNLGKSYKHDSMPREMVKILLKLMELRLTERSKLIEAAGINERTFMRAIKQLKGLGYVRKFRTGNIRYIAITESGKSFINSIRAPDKL